jgi:hypothetical protein
MLAAALRAPSSDRAWATRGNARRHRREALCDAPGAAAAMHQKTGFRQQLQGLRRPALDICLGEHTHSAYRREPTTTQLGGGTARGAAAELVYFTEHMPSATNSTRPSGQPPLLLTRQQAATTLAMSLSHFERYVQPHVPVVRSGQLRLYRPSDLKHWADRHATTSASA